MLNHFVINVSSLFSAHIFFQQSKITKLACWQKYMLIPSVFHLTFSFFLRRLPLCASCSRSATGRAIPEAPVLASTTTFSSFLFSPPGGLASLYFSLFSRAFSSCSFNFVASSYKLWYWLILHINIFQILLTRILLHSRPFNHNLINEKLIKIKKNLKVQIKTSS